MKFKTTYIYAVIVVVIIIFFVVLVINNANDQTSISDVSSEQTMKNEVHDQFNSALKESPSKKNVSEKFSHMLEMYKKRVDENPEDTLALREYADFLTAAHRQDEAIPFYEKILIYDSKRIDIYFALTFIYYEKQNFKKAEELTNKILAIEKNNPQARYNLGAIYASTGKVKTTKQIWENLIEKNPNPEITELAKSSLNRLK